MDSKQGHILFLIDFEGFVEGETAQYVDIVKVDEAEMAYKVPVPSTHGTGYKYIPEWTVLKVSEDFIKRMIERRIAELGNW